MHMKLEKSSFKYRSAKEIKPTSNNVKYETVDTLTKSMVWKLMKVIEYQRDSHSH